MAETTRARLVLYRNESGAQGALYPTDATKFSSPLVTFPLAPEQRLPRVGHGAIVTVEGEVRRGSEGIVRADDGVVIVPAKPFRAGDTAGRMFAERGDLIGDPRVIGWDDSWETIRSASLDDVETWEVRLRRARRAGVAGLVLVLVVIAFVVLGSLDGRPPSLVLYWGGVGGFGSAITGWRHARKAQRTLDGARTNDHGGPTRSMAMTLWWAAGSWVGPQAVATLTDSDGTEVAQVPVVNVPARYDPPPGHGVEVVGDPETAPVIRDGAIVLWPAADPLEVPSANARPSPETDDAPHGAQAERTPQP